MDLASRMGILRIVRQEKMSRHHIVDDAEADGICVFDNWKEMKNRLGGIIKRPRQVTNRKTMKASPKQTVEVKMITDTNNKENRMNGIIPHSRIHRTDINITTDTTNNDSGSTFNATVGSQIEEVVQPNVWSNQNMFSTSLAIVVGNLTTESSDDLNIINQTKQSVDHYPLECKTTQDDVVETPSHEQVNGDKCSELLNDSPVVVTSEDDVVETPSHEQVNGEVELSQSGDSFVTENNLNMSTENTSILYDKFVFVKTLFGLTAAICAKPNDVVSSISARIKKKTGINIDQQLLVFKGNEISQTDVLNEIGIIPTEPPSEVIHESTGWVRGRGGVISPVGCQIIHLIVKPTTESISTMLSPPQAAIKKDTEDLISELMSLISVEENSNSGNNQKVIKLKRTLTKVMTSLEDGELTFYNENTEDLASQEMYKENKFFGFRESVTNKNKTLRNGDSPYFHEDGTSYRLNDVVKKTVNLDTDLNTSTLTPDQGEGVILGKSSLRPFNERMPWDTDIPLNVKIQLLGRDCPWIPQTTTRLVVYDNPSLTIAEIHEVLKHVHPSFIAENFGRIKFPESKPPAASMAKWKVKSRGAVGEQKKKKVKNTNIDTSRQNSVNFLETLPISKLITSGVRGVELQPGVVLFKGMLSIEVQQFIIDESFRLGTNKPGYSGGFYRVLEDGRSVFNQGHRGQFGEDLRVFAPHFSDLAKQFLLLGREASTDVDDLPDVDPHWCNFNLYSPRSPGILWHRDGDETLARIRSRRGRPIISFSFGLSSDFRFKNSNTENDKIVRLDSGDVLIFGGPSRNMLHAVTKIYPNTTPKLLRWNYPEGRLNLTYRHRN